MTHRFDYLSMFWKIDGSALLSSSFYKDLLWNYFSGKVSYCLNQNEIQVKKWRLCARLALFVLQQEGEADRKVLFTSFADMSNRWGDCGVLCRREVAAAGSTALPVSNPAALLGWPHEYRSSLQTCSSVDTWKPHWSLKPIFEKCACFLLK